MNNSSHGTDNIYCILCSYLAYVMSRTFYYSRIFIYMKVYYVDCCL